MSTKRFSRAFQTVLIILLAHVQTLQAEPPLPIGDYATIQELEDEAQARVTELESLLADESDYDEKQKRIEQVASMLAVMAQAMADHESESPRQPFAPDVREAALTIASAKEFTEANAGFAAAREALNGTSSRSAAKDVDWAKLVKQRDIMEEMEVRMLQLQRILRRPKDLEKQSLHATAVAVSNFTTLVDTQHVKEPEKLPAWNQLSRQMIDDLKTLATAMKNNQLMEAQAAFKATRATCVECHRQFKKEN